MKTGDRIKRIREQRRITQDTLAAACQVTTSCIGQIERNARNVKDYMIIRVCKALKCSPNELLGWDECETKEDAIRAIKNIVAGFE